MRIIPAIDIINGKCVRLSQGDFDSKKIYRDNPVEVAKEFEDSGIQYLHLVDLDGAKSRRIVNYKTLEEICHATNLQVDFGGGIKSIEDVNIAFNSGATQITCGSIAVKQPVTVENWIKTYGSNKVILGADCKDENIATEGWVKQSSLNVVDFIKTYERKGIEFTICTDISKDGMLGGPAFELYQELLSVTEVKLIASGGISSIADLEKLKSIGCEGAIIGKAIYENRISLKLLSELC